MSSSPLQSAPGRAGTTVAVGGLDVRSQEYEFTDRDFRTLVGLAHSYAGISLSEGKRNLVYGRLTKRLRALGLSSFREYSQLLRTPEGEPEIEQFINSISTNLTRFFREPHHFEHLRSHVAVPLAQRIKTSGKQRLRIWSAGCSTGEEPYTIAFILAREVPDLGCHDVRILATDIDTAVLSQAAAGQYPTTAMADVPASYREFIRRAITPVDRTSVSINPDLRNLIRFRRLNLMETWPFKGKFDAIFCRNVMIYFDSPTKAKLIDRFVDHIVPGGFLYIGHSESLLGSHPRLELLGRTIYRRIAK
jgi:chemotaxis protein methyltransferase CheR